MKFFIPYDITFQSTNVSENETETGDAYIPYNKIAGVNTGSIRKYGRYIYSALTLMYPIVRYIWEDLIADDTHLVDLHNGTETYPIGGVINVAITDNVTTVYVRSQEKYYIAKATGTFDFMIEDPTNPAHFNLVASPAPYRNEVHAPVGTTDTLYWGYEGVANKYGSLDDSIGTQTTKFGADLIQTFDVNAANALAAFFLDGTEAQLDVYDMVNPASPLLVDTQILNLVDTSLLYNYERVCTISPRYKPTVIFTFQARYTMRLTLTIRNTLTSPKCGAIKVGQMDDLGQTLDKVSISTKSYNTVEQRSNGEYVWNKDEKESNKVFILRYNLKFDTTAVDAMSQKVKSIIDKQVVLLGDDGDSAGFSTLINYGAIKNASVDLESNNSKSNGTVEIENFI